jgi:hypothetical protein
VHAADGAAEGLWGYARVGGRAANCVVEDEDAGGAGTGGILVSVSLFGERKQSEEEVRSYGGVMEGLTRLSAIAQSLGSIPA